MKTAVNISKMYLYITHLYLLFPKLGEPTLKPSILDPRITQVNNYCLHNLYRLCLWVIVISWNMVMSWLNEIGMKGDKAFDIQI